MNQILMVAAETSSALYARRLLEHWRHEGKNVKCFGVGDASMVELGFEALGRAEDMAVVGIQEVLSHWSVIKEAFDSLVAEAEKRKPAMALLLDYPDFNLRLAKKLKKLGVPVVYYISPQVWAWRRSRVHLIKRVVDKILVAFPFEKEFYDGFQMPNAFVGHPLLDEISAVYFDPIQVQLKRSKKGIAQGERVLGLMPGSRRSEIKHHLKVQIAVAEELIHRQSNLRIALLVAPNLDLEWVKGQLPDYDFPLMVIQDDPLEMISQSDLLLVASGTATLLTGLLEKPMVIMYRMNFFTALLARAFVRSTPFFGMINLVLGEKVVPEYFQQEASVTQLCAALESFLTDKSLWVQTVNRLKAARTKLGKQGATLRVAREVNTWLER